MIDKDTRWNAHAVAYGVAAVFVFASAAILFLIHDIATSWDIENYERVSFGILLLVGLPLIFLYDWGAGKLSERTGVAASTLGFWGTTAVLATILALPDVAEEGDLETGIWWFFGEMLLAALAISLFVLVWNWGADRLKLWWRKRTDRA